MFPVGCARATAGGGKFTFGSGRRFAGWAGCGDGCVRRNLEAAVCRGVSLLQRRLTVEDDDAEELEAGCTFSRLAEDGAHDRLQAARTVDVDRGIEEPLFGPVQVELDEDGNALGAALSVADGFESVTVGERHLP